MNVQSTHIVAGIPASEKGRFMIQYSFILHAVIHPLIHLPFQMFHLYFVGMVFLFPSLF